MGITAKVNKQKEGKAKESVHSSKEIGNACNLGIKRHFSSTANGHSSKTTGQKAVVGTSLPRTVVTTLSIPHHMALQIIDNFGVYEIKGDLNAQNVLSLHHHFDALRTHSKTETAFPDEIIEKDDSPLPHFVPIAQEPMHLEKEAFLTTAQAEAANTKYVRWEEWREELLRRHLF